MYNLKCKQMKNLEVFLDANELSKQELQNIDGGFVCGGLCIAGIAIVVGGLVGWAVSEVVHHHS